MADHDTIVSPRRTRDPALEDAMPGHVAILGVTGRLGRALVRALPAGTWRGLARHGHPALAAAVAGPGPAADAPADARADAPADEPALVLGDRRDPVALRRVLDGAAAVVDLCAFAAEDVAPVRAVLAGLHRAPGRVVFASALAERRPERWATPPGPDAGPAAEPRPDDAYGQGKIRARQAWTATGLPVATLLLPQLLAPDDPAPREAAYLATARTDGVAWLPGDGRQAVTVAAVDTVAAVIVALLARPTPWSGRLQVAPPAPVVLAGLVAALLAGAGLPAVPVRPHPDPRWRGPHAGGDERVDTAALQALLPDLAWPDLLAAARDLGARLATG